MLLGNRLRQFSYSQVPAPGEVADEYAYGWLGLSLIENQYPISWSLLPFYPDKSFEKINVDGLYDLDPNRVPFPIVKPWFDHPPLFGLLVGGYSYLKGVRDFKDASVILLRRPMLKIALLTTLLIYILGSELFNKQVGFLSAFLYSIIPSSVISSRLALMENALIPAFLISLILACKYQKQRRKMLWIMAVAVAGVALLIKLSAIAIGITLLLIVLYIGSKDKRFMLKSLFLSIAAFMIIYIIYGLLIDPKTFFDIFLANTHRFYGAGAEIVLQAVGQYRITTSKFLTDGWLLSGWISALILLFSGWKKDKGITFLGLALGSYLAVFILFGSESYGWYKFPFFPFLIIALAKILVEIYHKPNLLLFTILIFLPFGSGLHRLLGVEGFQVYVPAIRAFCLVFVLLFSLGLLKKSNKIESVQRVVMVLAFALVVWISIKEIYFFNFPNWLKVT